MKTKKQMAAWLAKVTFGEMKDSTDPYVIERQKTEPQWLEFYLKMSVVQLQSELRSNSC